MEGDGECLVCWVEWWSCDDGRCDGCNIMLQRDGSCCWCYLVVVVVVVVVPVAVVVAVVVGCGCNERNFGFNAHLSRLLFLLILLCI